MSSESITNIVLSSITAATAVAAIIISFVQIQKSNKQSLFERRLKAFLTVKWMMGLCSQNNTFHKTYLMEAKEGPLLTIDLLFVWMTNNAFLEDIQPVIQHCLESEWQRKYLLKMEELRNLCEEVRLIFPGFLGSRMSDFVFSYEEMLVWIYKYQVAIDSITKSSQKFNMPFPDNNDLEMNTRKMVVKYISDTFGYSELLSKESVLEKAEKNIRL